MVFHLSDSNLTKTSGKTVSREEESDLGHRVCHTPQDAVGKLAWKMALQMPIGL